MQKLLEEQTVQLLNMDRTRISPDFFPLAFSCDVALTFIKIFFILMTELFGSSPNFGPRASASPHPWVDWDVNDFQVRWFVQDNNPSGEAWPSLPFSLHPLILQSKTWEGPRVLTRHLSYLSKLPFLCPRQLPIPPPPTPSRPDTCLRQDWPPSPPFLSISPALGPQS